MLPGSCDLSLRYGGIRIPQQTGGETVEIGVRKGKVAFLSGYKPYPTVAPAGSNRSSHEG